MHFVDEQGLDFSGKRVLLRAGFDVALADTGEGFSVVETRRIEAGVSTIRFLLERGASVIILNHIGRPGGKVNEALSNKPVARVLEKLISEPVGVVSHEDTFSPERYPSGRVTMLENIRFFSQEEAADKNFAEQLGTLGNVYVNDAFSNCHRAHASMVALAGQLPAYGGLLLKEELNVLGAALDNPLHPLVLIIGGAKIETKIKILFNFWNKTENVILGGAIANTLLHAKGVAVGKSLIDSLPPEGLDGISLTDTRLHLPVDVRVAKDFEGKQGLRVAPVGNLEQDEIILDIGPDSEILFDNIVKRAKMIVWNGPIGKFEVPEFAKGTLALARSIKASSARSIIGGGETIEFLKQHQLLDAFSFVSTGGGAMLEYLSGNTLPALAALQ